MWSSQVHKGKLKGSGKGEFVAVKVQRKDVEPLMLMDLANLKHFAAFLQTFELPFDLLSVVQELEEQVGSCQRTPCDSLLYSCRQSFLYRISLFLPLMSVIRPVDVRPSSLHCILLTSAV